ncbi:MAG: mechanosensitive ion channel family protein [Bacilli bacterium]|jgi:small conductance mechanosensitive channel|nr:mechanosensitive ion channel family protein [Bacilli bacterium]
MDEKKDGIESADKKEETMMKDKSTEVKPEAKKEEKQSNKLHDWWSKKNREDKISFWTKCLWWTLGIAFLVVFLLSRQIFGADSILGQMFDQNGFVTIGEWFKNHWAAFIKSVVTVIVALMIYMIFKSIMKLVAVRGKAVKTIVSLIVSIVKYVVIIAAIFIVLQTWGVDTSTLVASLGILALVIGLGCQSLINDIVSGLFLITEKTFEVGDIVVIDDFRGTVDEIGIRSTKLVDAAGNIKIVNNSAIGSVVNLSQDLSVAICNVEVTYDVPIEKIEAVIADHIKEVKAKIPAIVEGPFYKGVSSLDSDAGMEVKFVAKCKEEDRYQVQRDLNRDLYIMFDTNGIDMPYTHYYMYKGEETDYEEATAKDIKKAEAFNKGQKEQAGGIEEQTKN